VVEGKNGKPRDMFHDRLMIPVRRPGDRVVIAFAGRRHPDAGDEHGPKYLNSPNTELYIKGHVLAGLAEGQRYLDAGAQPVFVEGYTDAWAVAIAAPGRYTGLPLCGTALTGEQVAALARTIDLPERGVRIALDPDNAGWKAAIRAYAPLSATTADITAVLVPGGNDPAEVLEYEGPVALRDALTASVRPLADLVVDACMERWERGGELATPEQQLGALRAACQAIATMPPHVAAQQADRITRLFITQLGWAHREVTRELLSAVEHHFHGTSPSCGQPDSAWPAATRAVVARAIAPYQGAAPPHPAGQPGPTMQHAGSAPQRGHMERGSGR
jgi:DNA primase